MIKIGRDIEMDLKTLIDSRALICANSGSGKSYAIRVILEESYGKVMSIVLDMEGEFKTLREKYDFLLIGKDGDVPINVNAAPLLPRKILELNMPTIIDLSDLKKPERVRYVKKFLDALMELPKKYWKPCLVVVGEAHHFSGQQEKQDSTWAVIDLMTRGRKRGFCGILDTQRISKLHKDAAAEASNKLIGRTWLDIDMKRAANELGFSTRSDMLLLRDLKPGEFYAFGVAIKPHHVHKITIKKAKTSHPKVGMDLDSKISPPTPRIKAMLSKLSDLPQEAEKELRTVEDLRAEVRSLRVENRRTSSQNAPTVDHDTLRKVREERNAAIESGSNAATKVKEVERNFTKLVNAIKRFSSDAKSIAEVANFEVPVLPKKIPIERIHTEAKPQPTPDLTENNENVTGGAVRMLRAAAMYFPESVSRARMATIARMSHKSGTFGTYLALLKRNGLLVVDGNNFTATDAGMKEAGDVPPVPSGRELLEMWKGIVKGGAARMLQALADEYPNEITKEELGEMANISPRSGTFGTYLALLKRNGLVKVRGRMVNASVELMKDG